MPLDLEQQILKILRGMKSGDRPATFGDLSRRLGVSSPVIVGCTRQMVRSGVAQPAMITVKGVQELHGLLGQPSTADDSLSRSTSSGATERANAG